MRTIKLYNVEFEGIYPVGSCLVIKAFDIFEAEEIVKKTLSHTKTFEITEVDMSTVGVVKYLSGNY